MSELASPAPEYGDIRPVVPLSGGGRAGLIAAVVALLLGGYLVFSMLAERRAALTAPRTALAPGSTGEPPIASPPPLALPGTGYDAYPYGEGYPVVLRRLPRAMPPPAPFVAGSGAAPRGPLPRAPQPYSVDPVLPPQQRTLAPVGVFDSGANSGVASPPAATGAGPARVRADKLVNPSQTVPQGTVIRAVLETALDSTRAGAVRALVQRDVWGFDGTQVLIPRGSRLYGEYEADLAAGQKRAAIKWTRLLRPDGVTIALDSPASDPLGRAGVKGKVDSKFFQRFGGALLQSVLDIGVGVATRQATKGVVVALPGSTQNLNLVDQNVRPTLTVKQGTSVSVFVSRDLDFSWVGN
jgi:type IV secretion system protein VirB10